MHVTGLLERREKRMRVLHKAIKVVKRPLEEFELIWSVRKTRKVMVGNVSLYCWPTAALFLRVGVYQQRRLML